MFACQCRQSGSDRTQWNHESFTDLSCEGISFEIFGFLMGRSRSYLFLTYSYSARWIFICILGLHNIPQDLGTLRWWLGIIHPISYTRLIVVISTACHHSTVHFSHISGYSKGICSTSMTLIQPPPTNPFPQQIKSSVPLVLRSQYHPILCLLSDPGNYLCIALISNPSLQNIKSIPCLVLCLGFVARDAIVDDLISLSLDRV